MEILHSIRIRHNIALESQIGTQTVVQPILATLNWLAIIVVVRAHNTQQASSCDNLTPRVDMNLLDRVWRLVRIGTSHTLTSTLTIRVYSKVLSSCGYATILLQALNHLHTHLRNEERIFAINLLVATPTLITTNIEDWGIDIGVTQQLCLFAGNAANLSDKLFIPGRAESELRREVCRLVCLNATNTLVGEIYGDAQASLLDKEALHLVQSPSVIACRPNIGALGG